MDEMLGSPTILNGIDMKGRGRTGRGCWRRHQPLLADIGRGKALGGDVGPIDVVEVDQLESPDTHGGQLQGELSSDRPDTNDRDRCGRSFSMGIRVRCRS